MDRSELTKAMRWYIADRLAEEKLGDLNAKLVDVVPRDTFYSRHIKRAIDIAISLVVLLIALPINAIIAVCTYFSVGWPLLFHQERVGKDNKLFVITKFRNMRNTRDERGELLPPEQRVTRFGRFVRKTSLDELLNFWSILKGDMSLIGPRPLVPEYIHRYNKRHVMRTAVRPGLECPPAKDLQHVWTWQEQFDNDIWYVENVSFKTDVFMAWRLVKFAFDRRSASARAMSVRGIFMGYSDEGKAINLSQVPQAFIDKCVAEYENGTITQIGA